MPFVVIDERRLLDGEVEEMLAYQRLHPGMALNRRGLLLSIGSAVVLSIQANPNAVAQGSQLSDAIIQGGIALSKARYAIQETIRATFSLLNDTREVQRRPTFAAVSTLELGIVEQELVFAELLPRTTKVIHHSGFEARVIGKNDYLAKTQVSRASMGFIVQQ
ncbi:MULTISPECIES: hypothetical protein [unclassified Bradyrhizobium]|uniref:hypothetical protein n=1 Tax=unclassified Bradyrhizobium TaxID=2631580 RepID=UPI001FF865CD|nr:MULTISPECIES: hypothetical protein [unclassified Bradyrhizobium]MCK1424814.1 hypothetical protein [Bradyrhizobium sp. CW12]MCK1644254.1 hypothetical protein [Bradyrhizobium sp. 154]